MQFSGEKMTILINLQTKFVVYITSDIFKIIRF